jgi:hypothetical protein
MNYINVGKENSGDSIKENRTMGTRDPTQLIERKRDALDTATERLPDGTRIEDSGNLGLNGNKLSPGGRVSFDCEKEMCLASEKGAHFFLFDLN